MASSVNQDSVLSPSFTGLDTIACKSHTLHRPVPSITPRQCRLRCYYPGVPFVLFPAHLPLTSANICKVINAIPIPCPLCFAVPYVIKASTHDTAFVYLADVACQLLGETEEGIRALAQFESVNFAGAAVPVSSLRSIGWYRFDS